MGLEVQSQTRKMRRMLQEHGERNLRVLCLGGGDKRAKRALAPQAVSAQNGPRSAVQNTQKLRSKSEVEGEGAGEKVYTTDVCSVNHTTYRIEKYAN
jgi:hypothetical protein